jgi:hypothetical protein
MWIFGAFLCLFLSKLFADVNDEAEDVKASEAQIKT